MRRIKLRSGPESPDIIKHQKGIVSPRPNSLVKQEIISKRIELAATRIEAEQSQQESTIEILQNWQVVQSQQYKPPLTNFYNNFIKQDVKQYEQEMFPADELHEDLYSQKQDRVLKNKRIWMAHKT